MPLTEEQQLMNNEFFYKMKARPETVYYPGLKANREDGDKSGTTHDELLKLKDYASIQSAGGQYGGSWFRRYKTEMDEVTDKQDTFTKQARTGKKLEEFYEDGDESERDEEDIYEHYQEMVSRRREQG